MTSRTTRSPILPRALLSLVVALAAALWPRIAYAGDSVVVTTLEDQNDGTPIGGLSLRDAITVAQADGNEVDTILFHTGIMPGTITLTRGALPVVSETLTINGSSAIAIDGNSRDRILVVSLPDASDDFTLRNIALARGWAMGGDGGDGYGGGGGAAGMGGALFVNKGSVYLSNVTFIENTALGGDGGDCDDDPTTLLGGGGGGLGGDGGSGDSGDPSGGSGGFLGGEAGSDGGEAGDGAGGSGGGADGVTTTTASPGGYGGGGGGSGNGSWDNDGARVGGDGGYGAGGGGATGPSETLGGLGGDFGGNGGDIDDGGRNDGAGGGGGAGLGGAIFVRDATTTFSMADCAFYGNRAIGGDGGDGKGDGEDGAKGKGKGGAIFISTWPVLMHTNTTFADNYASDPAGDLFDNDDYYGGLTCWFNYTQSFSIDAYGHFFGAAYNYHRNEWAETLDANDSTAMQVEIPPTQWLGLFLYDYGDSVWTQGLYVYAEGMNVKAETGY